MKKYISCAAIAMLTMSLLTGCSSGIELTDEENDMVAEYMATALLKYDSQYEASLIYAEAAESVKEEEPFVPVDTMEEDKKVEDTQTSNEASGESENNGSEEENLQVEATATLKDIFKSKNYEVSFAGVKECETYKEEGNEYFIVEAPSDCKLVVVQFAIKNTSGKDIAVALADENILYSFSAKGISGEKPLLTALMGDLQYYNETIPAGKSKEAVILFAVNKNADISDGTVTLQKESGEICRISVK